MISIIIGIWKYNHLAGSSYEELWNELDHPRKGLINIENTDDNECFNVTHREKIVLYWIQYKKSLKYKVGCFWRF